MPGYGIGLSAPPVVGGGGSPAFTPESLPGIARWGEPSTLPASGTIASWPDSSAAGNNATQAVEADKPTVTTLGTAKASSHTLSGEVLTLDTEAAALTGEEAFFAAALLTGSGTIYPAGGALPFRGVVDTAQTLKVYVAGGLLTVSTANAVPAGSEGVYAWYRDAGGTWRAWKRDVGGNITEITLDPATVGDGQWGIVDIGGLREATPYVGSIGAHVIAVGSALTDAQIEDTVNFLFESQGFV